MDHTNEKLLSHLVPKFYSSNLPVTQIYFSGIAAQKSLFFPHLAFFVKAHCLDH
jgi:hypothetical protein